MDTIEKTHVNDIQIFAHVFYFFILFIISFYYYKGALHATPIAVEVSKFHFKTPMGDVSSIFFGQFLLYL